MTSVGFKSLCGRPHGA